MIIHTMPQGSEEWHEVRLGKLTGTNAATLLVHPKDLDKLGVGAMSVVYDKASELITGEWNSFQGNHATQRGNELEPYAIESYEEHEWSNVTKVGFVELNPYIGMSPDGLIGSDGTIEVKCPMGKEFMRMVDGTDKITKEHLAQMQFGLFVTGRKWCDYVRYHPRFKNKQLLIDRIHRDEEMMKIFEGKIKAFQIEVERLINLVESPLKKSIAA